MAKATCTKQLILTLTLTEEEAHWLKEVVQHQSEVYPLGDKERYVEMLNALGEIHARV